MTVRYFVPQMSRQGGSVDLPEAEAHHASTVMRIRPGDAVTLFDGRGYQAAATIDSVSRRRVSCCADPAEYCPRGNPREVSLAIAMPKGERARELVQRLTELGIERVVPIHCQRSPWSVSDGALQKWKRVMVEACKQSGRNRLMEIERPCALGDYLARGSSDQEVAWLAHPNCKRNLSSALDGLPAPVAPTTETPVLRLSVRAAIGPEGGFTQEEAAAAEQNGWIPIDLGERIYRIETAAIILAIKAAGI